MEVIDVLQISYNAFEERHLDTSMKEYWEKVFTIPLDHLSVPVREFLGGVGIDITPLQQVDILEGKSVAAWDEYKQKWCFIKTDISTC